jgi:uncharacterized protein (DUF2132 family)
MVKEGFKEGTEWERDENEEPYLHVFSKLKKTGQGIFIFLGSGR